MPMLIVAAHADGTRPVTVTGHFWAPFISPMGEPFRAKGAGENTLAKWFVQADRDADGALTAAEMQADAERFFATLDTDHDGQIDPDELVHYEWEVAPDIQVMSRTRPDPAQASASPQERGKQGDRKPRFRDGDSHGFQGAARYALLNMPEPVAAADANLDRSITLDEFRKAAMQRFALLDQERRGTVSLAQLQSLLPGVNGRQAGKRKDDPDDRVAVPVPIGN
jgi:Ca2+-binding EF-hand superfamily protein